MATMGWMERPETHAPRHARRYVYVGFAMLQCFLCAGVIYGWTSILPVLEQERIYNEYCQPGETICEAQSEKLHFAFTIAGSSSMCSNLVLGLFFDRFGPRYTKVLSVALIMIGAVLMGNAHYRADHSGSDLLLPGMALLGFAGPGVQLSGIHLSNLFPEAKALVTCFIVGALQLSFFIFTFFDLLYEHAGVSKAAIFNGYAFVLFLTLIGSLVMDPDTPYELDERRRRLTEHELLSPIKLPTAFNEEHTPLLSSTPELTKYRKQKSNMYYGDDDDDYDDVSDLPYRSFKTQARSTPFLLMCFFFSIESLWCNFFIGSVTAQLRWQRLPAADVSALLSDLAVILPSSVVFIPLVGYLLESWGYMHVTFLCAASALAFTAMSWSTVYGVVVAAFVLYALFRTILFSVLFAYIGQTFGFKHFGALTGIAFCVGALVGLVQTPIAAIGDYQTIGYIQFTDSVVAFGSIVAADLSHTGPKPRESQNKSALKHLVTHKKKEKEAHRKRKQASKKEKMSRFSIVNVMTRRSTVSSEGSERPSIISTLDLNRQLNEEAKRVDQHLFFGPQQAVFEGDRTRVIHGERKIQKNSKKFWLVSEPLSMDRDSTTSLIGFPTEPPPKQGLANVTSTLSAAGRYIGQKVAQMKFPPTHINEDSFCDGCGMDPIVGNMYSCSKCENYSLCESCYQSGIHGFEDSDLLKNVREDFALRNVMETCRHKVPEKVFSTLLKTVCRGQVDKFNFLATWICSVVLEHPIHELSVRGIEIPHLDQETRTTLVTLLTPVLAERNDLEVCMEWFCPEADNENVPNSKRRAETLRIWVATDKDSKSPFTSKEPKDIDTESDMSPTSGSGGDLIHSPGPASPSMSVGEPESPEGTPPSSPTHNDGSSSSFTSPPASPQFGALSLKQDDDDDEDSVKSDIAPRKVDGVSASGQPSEGIAM